MVRSEGRRLGSSRTVSSRSILSLGETMRIVGSGSRMKSTGGKTNRAQSDGGDAPLFQYVVPAYGGDALPAQHVRYGRFQTLLHLRLYIGKAVLDLLSSVLPVPGGPRYPLRRPC